MLFTFSPGSVPLSPATETFVKSVTFKVEIESELSTVPFPMIPNGLTLSWGRVRVDGVSMLLVAQPAVNSLFRRGCEGNELLLISSE